MADALKEIANEAIRFNPHCRGHSQSVAYPQTRLAVRKGLSPAIDRIGTFDRRLPVRAANRSAAPILSRLARKKIYVMVPDYERRDPRGPGG